MSTIIHVKLRLNYQNINLDKTLGAKKQDPKSNLEISLVAELAKRHKRHLCRRWSHSSIRNRRGGHRGSSGCDNKEDDRRRRRRRNAIEEWKRGEDRGDWVAGGRDRREDLAAHLRRGGGQKND